MTTIIGITAYVERARFSVWDTTATLVPHDYVGHVVRAGGQPVMLPPVGNPTDLLAHLDGLIIVGGGDMGPARYGATAHERTGGVRDLRDDAELELARAAPAHGVPLLGICRGLQVLNVALGGTLHQHLPDLVDDARHQPAPGEYGRSPVRVEPGSRLHDALGRTEVTVAHHHHQSVDRLGDGLLPVAWSDDGVVEGAELSGRPFVVGVQWHPEVGDDPSLFDALVAAARSRPTRVE